MCFWYTYVHISLGIYLGAELLGYRVCVCSALVTAAKWLLSDCSDFHFLVEREISGCSTSSSILVVFFLFNFSPPSRCAVYFSKTIFFVSYLSFLGFSQQPITTQDGNQPHLCVKNRAEQQIICFAEILLTTRQD